jgi:5-methyltetrahydropteroyltriglutamate--homocysteine methyltransferase
VWACASYTILFFFVTDMIKTSTIGSYAWPAWFIQAVEGIRRGEYGPKDIEETLGDAVDTALRDQEEAGVDVVTDGEMRRLGFFTADFYGRLTGLREQPPQRRIGPAGHDQRERYEAVEAISAPNGLGLVEEYRYVRGRTSRPVKVPCPGPFTLAGRILTGAVYGDRMEVAYAFADLINGELKRVVEAGADFIQLDEPSYAVHSDAPEAFVELFNRTVEGVEARIGLHLCFGNFVGRPVAHRTYRPLFPHILELRTDELDMEFANREMAEIGLMREVAEAGKTVAAGLVDVKNYFIEPPDLVATRVREVLRYVPPEQLVVTPDCGFSQTARWAARAKLKSMVEGVRIVNRELALGA